MNFRILLLLISSVFSLNAWAHKAGDSYLNIVQDGPIVTVGWDVALRDLDVLLVLDSDDDKQLTWGEVRQRSADIEQLLLQNLSIRAGDDDCRVLGQSSPLAIVQHSDGNYAALRWLMSCNNADTPLSIDYRLLNGIDALHRGLLTLSREGQTTSAVLRPDVGPQLIDSDTSLWTTFTRFCREGIHHLLSGYDHILFLLCLLLPACLIASNGRWQSTASLRQSLWQTTAVVTAFTVAHSITLALAALNIIALPSRWVESAIAASIVVAAIHTIWPRVIRSRALLAGGFGLIHGFGFAGVLQGLPLTTGPRLSALAGFNVGVELGQLSIVLIAFPVLWSLRHSAFYNRILLPLIAVLIALVATLWLLQRIFLWQLIPG